MLAALGEWIDSASRHAAYADARHVRTRREAVTLRNGALGSVDNHEEEGFGVRVRVGGAWGFAASRGSSATPARTRWPRACRGRGAAPV